MNKENVFLLILLSLLISAFSIYGQNITWTDQTATVSLPQGVRFFKGERSNPLLKAWYIDIDLADTIVAIHH